MIARPSGSIQKSRRRLKKYLLNISINYFLQIIYIQRVYSFERVALFIGDVVWSAPWLHSDRTS